MRGIGIGPTKNERCLLQSLDWILPCIFIFIFSSSPKQRIGRADQVPMLICFPTSKVGKRQCLRRSFSPCPSACTYLFWTKSLYIADLCNMLLPWPFHSCAALLSSSFDRFPSVLPLNFLWGKLSHRQSHQLFGGNINILLIFSSYWFNVISYYY